MRLFRLSIIALGLFAFTLMALIRDASEFDTEIYIISVENGSLHNLTHNRTDDEHAVWSPDGSQIAYVSDRDGSSDIFVMSADGSNQRRLTYHGSNQFPVWSPDGSQIAYISHLSSNPFSDFYIYVMGVDGSNQRRIRQVDNGY